MGGEEESLVTEAFASNWIAPLGPHVDGFENELAAFVEMPHAVALSSGTAALHLALVILGLGPGDRVLVSTLTFAATVNAISYVGAIPVFVDVETHSWTLDPDLVEQAFVDAARSGKRFRALMTVDLYGQCADYDRLQQICDQHDVLLIEDAAEAVGSKWNGRPAGQFGCCAAFSFNGNKIMTTGGGGMLVSRDAALVQRVRYLSTQAREPAPHYQHVAIGYNYRMSNLLAAIGRGQLRGLPARMARRREINERYRSALAGRSGFTFLEETSGRLSNHWLTCIQIDSEIAGVSREEIRTHLETLNIESRPVWKPMHMQPVFASAECIGGDVAARLFERGLCLPSGSSLTDDDQTRVIAGIEEACG
jgi:dTDP-4-amino-4,6-dideoxygalactose transaminase